MRFVPLCLFLLIGIVQLCPYKSQSESVNFMLTSSDQAKIWQLPYIRSNVVELEFHTQNETKIALA